MIGWPNVARMLVKLALARLAQCWQLVQLPNVGPLARMIGWLHVCRVCIQVILARLALCWSKVISTTVVMLAECGILMDFPMVVCPFS